MLVCDKYNFLLLPKMLVLNPKDGNLYWKRSDCQCAEPGAGNWYFAGNLYDNSFGKENCVKGDSIRRETNEV